MFTKGQIVFSKTGRDKGKAFIVVLVDRDEKYVHICDGKVHKLDKSKKKNAKHIQMTNIIDENLKSLIENDGYIQDAMIRKALLPFISIN
ncbi:MAG: hypothetical protein ACK5LY_04145 [Lachnospirales bacterium]